MPADSGPTRCPIAARTSPWTFRVFYPSPAFPSHNRPLDPASALCRRISALSAYKFIAMSGSRTASPIRAPSPTPHSSNANESSTTTTGGGSAYGETSTGAKWWTAEDLKGQDAGSSESITGSAYGTSRILTGEFDQRLLNTATVCSFFATLVRVLSRALSIPQVLRRSCPLRASALPQAHPLVLLFHQRQLSSSRLASARSPKPPRPELLLWKV